MNIACRTGASSLAGAGPARAGLEAFAGAGRSRPGRACVVAVLLGTGVVGGEFLKLLDTPAASSLALVGVANSRCQQVDRRCLARRDLRRRLDRGEGQARDNDALLAALEKSDAPCRVVIDATADTGLAARHADWLARGFHVATANKAANGGPLEGWRRLRRAQRLGATTYGDAATVGAGLPALATLRRLRACGDSLSTLEGVFSGSLGWLFNTYDGRVPFSRLLLRARESGYSEPDPRMDLSGQDVARKLLILARTAGLPLTGKNMEAENLVPESLRALDLDGFLAAATALDEPLAARHRAARSRGRVLRYLARLDSRGRARIGLVEVAPDHPAANLRGTDNQFVFTTRRYAARPLVIQGPGAGAGVTAQALLGGILSLPR